jgi:hypothetical protein
LFARLHATGTTTSLVAKTRPFFAALDALGLRHIARTNGEDAKGGALGIGHPEKPAQWVGANASRWETPQDRVENMATTHR